MTKNVWKNIYVPKTISAVLPSWPKVMAHLHEDLNDLNNSNVYKMSIKYTRTNAFFLSGLNI